MLTDQTMVIVAMVVLTAVLVVYPPVADAMDVPADKYRNSKVHYNIKVENRMPAKETMQIDCRSGFHCSLGPGQSDNGTFSSSDYVGLYEILKRRRNVTNLPNPPRAYCAWAYAGNYMNNVPIFNVEWPEAARCTGRGSYCTVVFDAGQMFVEAPGMPRRLLGDLAIKRCKRHYWLFGWVGSDCSLPPHQNPYAGYVVDGWWWYQYLRDDPNNL